MPTPEGVSGIDTSKAQAYTSTKKDTKKSPDTAHSIRGE